MDITIDVETDEAQDERIREHVTKKAIAKAPDDVDEDALSKLIADALRATSLNAAFGEIVSIAAAINDRDPKTWARPRGGSERELLMGFREDIRAACMAARDRVVLVGHNIVGFDMRFIRQRGMVHGLAMPTIITQDVKPWEACGDKVYDTMYAWTGGNRGAISLDDLCVALGLEGKGDVSGNDVAALMAAGRWQDVARYNASDVVKTRACKMRMTRTE